MTIQNQKFRQPYIFFGTLKQGKSCNSKLTFIYQLFTTPINHVEGTPQAFSFFKNNLGSSCSTFIGQVRSRSSNELNLEFGNVQSEVMI